MFWGLSLKLKLQKQQNKLSQKPKQKKKPADTKKENDKATKIKDAIGLIRIILENVMQPFGRYLKIEIVKIYVKIASEDAAKTAFLYGIASQSLIAACVVPPRDFSGYVNRNDLQAFCGSNTNRQAAANATPAEI